MIPWVQDVLIPLHQSLTLHLFLQSIRRNPDDPVDEDGASHTPVIQN